MNFSKNSIWSPKEYAEHAIIAHDTGQELLSRLIWMSLKPNLIVEVGSGMGELSEGLQTRYPKARVLAVDHSQAMLDYSRVLRPDLLGICAEGARLPLTNSSVDLLAANFLLPWHPNINLLFKEWRRVLAADGLLMLSTLGPDTLQECREWVKEDEMPHLADVHDIGDQLLQQGFSDPVLDVSQITVTYRSKEKLTHELMMSGMLNNPHTLDDWEPNEDGKWQLSYEIIFAHAFQPAVPEEIAADADGTARIPLNHLRRQLGSRIK